MPTAETQLAEALMLLEGFTSGGAWLRVGGVDVTAREIVILKREIAFYEKVLARRREPALT